jgi:hypothetical protein
VRNAEAFGKLSTALHLNLLNIYYSLACADNVGTLLKVQEVIISSCFCVLDKWLESGMTAQCTRLWERLNCRPIRQIYQPSCLYLFPFGWTGMFPTVNGTVKEVNTVLILSIPWKWKWENYNMLGLRFSVAVLMMNSIFWEVTLLSRHMEWYPHMTHKTGWWTLSCTANIYCNINSSIVYSCLVPIS